MANERKQDLGGPDDEALEQRIHDMLDITAPDTRPPEHEAEKPVEVPAKPTKITISQPTDDTPTAPQLPSKKPAKKSVSIVVSHDEEVSTATEAKPADPELAAAIEAANEQLAEQGPPTAPELPTEAEKPKKAPTKVVITHFDDTTVEDKEAAESSEPSEEATAEPIVSEQEAGPEAEPVVEESPLEPEIESAATEQAVSDIIASESDELLAIKDQKPEKVVAGKPKKSKKKRHLFKSSGFRWTLGLALFAALVGVGLTPTTRYAILNAAGVRSSASLVVFDQSTQQPLKNVAVSIAGQKAQTDANGVAKLEQLRLGPAELVVEKRAYATLRRAETIGWGSNPLSEANIKPTGSQYSFTVTDALSGKPLGNAEAIYGESNANADDKGVIGLTLDKIDDQQQIKVQVRATGYRDEIVDLSLSSKQNVAVKLVPVHKVAFVSKRSGKYDVYKIDVDGKNEKLVLAGTGNEQSNLVLAPHGSEDVAMLVASREGKHTSDGALLNNLTFVNLKDGSTKQVAESTLIRPVDWVGTRFVYVQTVVGAKPDDPARDKLMSFDYTSGDNRQLAASNYFNDIVVANGKVYYAPASAYQQGVNLGMFTVHADGSGKQSVFGQEVWSMSRTSYDHLILAVQQDWYDYTVGDGKPAKLNGQPTNTVSRLYSDSPDGKHSIWIDNRDGKGTLISYDTASKTEKVIFAQAGVKGPVRWISNNALVFRMVNGKESADYVVSIDGGEAKKLVDVTDTKGIDRYTY